MPPLPVTLSTTPLTVDEAALVLDLAGRDLSEQFRLSVSSRDGSVTHVRAYAAGLGLVGYAQFRPGPGSAGPGSDEPSSAELVVATRARRQGVGSALVGALPADVRLWSHASGVAGEVAEAFARSLGLVPVRSLQLMARSLVEGPEWGSARLPDRYGVRTFEVGRDEDAWVAVNAAAFASHPEQGSLQRADLEQRMAQPWWDPAGLILVVDAEAPDTIAAFHWTKVDPPSGSVGEVYVVGVSPEHQGEGLGKAVTILGLDHLRDKGLRDVVLYVDDDNVAAVHTYASLGFTDVELHRQYTHP